MIYSMTAFAHKEKRDELAIITCEIRSINHRYLEPGLRIPDTVSVLEPRLREVLREKLQRGKIDCIIRLQFNPQRSANLMINHEMAKHLMNAAQEISHSTKMSAQLNLVDILRWPGVVQSGENDLASLQVAIIGLFSECIDELLQARAREGAELQKVVEQRLTEISARLVIVQKRLPILRQHIQHKLESRLADLQINVDPQRLEQEIVLYVQKVDVAEEMDRIQSHLKEFKRTLKSGGSIGRRLDFLIQELNREVNTMGSKIADSEILREVVELKVLLEQIREQIQNIE